MRSSRRLTRWLDGWLQRLPLPPRLVVALGFPYRWTRFGLTFVQGGVERLRRHAWWPFLTTLAIVFAILIGGPLLLGGGVWLLEQLGVSEKDIDPAPTISAWVSFTSVVLLTLAVLFARWLLRARNRVVVESFVDFTKEEATAVSGLSTLLVTELGRLRGLYHQIDDLSVPTAVGVERHGGFGRGKEAGDFLTVSADDRTDVLQSVVSSDTTVQLGPAKIPIGPILNFLGRLARGPRVVGSVHLTEAGGGPTLTAQLVDKELNGTWRVDQEREPESEAERKAFLDSMVRRLACQIFTQVALKGSIRWQAVEPFNEYLRLYGVARRTPRDRASFLKQAQERLLEAVTEDERFDLAYYNLGVIYTQLAHTERVAEERSDDATSQASFDRSELEAARIEAARAAFARAIAQNPDRWEAYYALAVTIFSGIEEVEIDRVLESDDGEVKQLQKVIELCEQVLAVNHGASLAAVYDLRGMAQVRLCQFRPAMASHRRAMHHAWVEYCRARRSDVGRPTGQPGLTEHARANATAALHNLALAYERRAATRQVRRPVSRNGGRRRQPLRERLDRSTSQGLLKWAGRRAGEGSVVSAACRFERGAALEHAYKYRRAASSFKRAARIQPLSPEYQACAARALAKRVQRRRTPLRKVLTNATRNAEIEAEARECAERAVHLLARPFSRAVIPFTPQALDLLCEATLDALEKTYRVLGESREAGEEAEREFAIARERIEEMQAIRDWIDEASTEDDDRTGRTIKRRAPEEGVIELGAWLEVCLDRPDERLSAWERDQVELAMGRLSAEAQDWEQMLTFFTELVKRLTARKEVDRLVEFAAHAHKARALREVAAREEHREDEIDGYVEALKTAAEGVRRDPLDVEARREAGRAHFALGQFSDALAAWEHALWLSPSDPYLHYEVAMCFRQIAHDQPTRDEHRRLIDCAKEHFSRAQELFDGEDLEGEAWTRFWRGKIALEEGQPTEALKHLRGAEHGGAEAAAALLIGEAHLALDQRPAADHAFVRCELAAARMREDDEFKGRPTIDWRWGDELPWKAVDARILRGRAEAVHLAPGDWQSKRQVEKAEQLLREARGHAEDIEDHDARDATMTQVLDTHSLLVRVSGNIDRALDLVRQRLRYEKTPEALRVEAELLELRAKWGKRLPQAKLAELAAEHTWQSIPGDGRPILPRVPMRRRVEVALKTGAEKVANQFLE